MNRFEAGESNVMKKTQKQLQIAIIKMQMGVGCFFFWCAKNVSSLDFISQGM